MILNHRLPLRYIFSTIKWNLLYVILVSASVHLISHWLKDYIPKMPLNIPVFMGTAISILLSFTLNQSYERWWEARKIWGAIVNDSRSFVLQLQAYCKDKSFVQKLAYRQVGFNYILGDALRNKTLSEDYATYFTEQDFTEIQLHTNKALAVLQQNTLDISDLKNKGEIELFAQIQIDNTLTNLCASMGMAERIKNTVFPTTYRLFLHFSIFLFIAVLSIGLEDVPIYFEIPILTVISLIFLLMEKAGTLLQDPFENRPTDIAITAIARTIEINTLQLLGETKIPAPLEPVDFYLN